jgi:hypothetical protein
LFRRQALVSLEKRLKNGSISVKGASITTAIGRATRALLLSILGIPHAFAFAQSRGAATPGTIAGVVFDSIGSVALRGASVQVVGAADAVLGRRFTAVTDSAGRYSIAELPAGRYLAGFDHPRLDSLGIESEQRAVTIGDASFRLDFATPSPKTFVALVCPDFPTGGLVVGHVRTTGSQAPLPNAGVVASWSELDTTGVFAAQRNQHRTIRTSPTGWFALCGLPQEAAFLARAGADTDSSGYVRISPTRTSVHVVTFHVGGAVRAATSPEAGLPAAWRGEAELSGIVHDDRGRPMPSARLSLWGTENETTTDARGRFRLSGLPGGTQTAEVRAIGYQPAEQTVHLWAGEPASVDISLRERVTELAGVNVTATAARARLAKFYERVRDSERGINHGYFITQEDIERRHPANLTQLLENIPNISMDRRGMPLDDVVLGPNRCRMTVYVDNIRVVGTLSGADEKINRLVPPSQVAAIEVYPRSVTAPPSYQSLNGTCGIILIWTK